MSVNDREFPRIIYKRHKQQHNKNGRQFARNASVIIYKIYRFRSLASRRKIIYKIYKISLASRAGDFKVTPTLLLPRKPPLLLRLRLFRMGYGSL